MEYRERPISIRTDQAIALSITVPSHRSMMVVHRKFGNETIVFIKTSSSNPLLLVFCVRK